jgi:hypothetical protein
MPNGASCEASLAECAVQVSKVVRTKLLELHMSDVWSNLVLD